MVGATVGAGDRTVEVLFRNRGDVGGSISIRSGAMFALDDGSGCVIHGFLCRDIKTPENPAKVGERWTVWGHMKRVPFQPAEVPPLTWTAVSHMRKH